MMSALSNLKRLCKFSFSFLFISSALLFSSCKSDQNGPINSGAHVVDPIPMGGEEVLDDGGQINHSDPIKVTTGVKFKKERRIVLGLDDDKYTLEGGAKIEDWAGAPVHRIKLTNTAQSITFRLDFSKVEDKSKVGCMMTLIRSRANMTVQVSLNQEDWTEIGYPERSAFSTSNIHCNYAEQVHDLRNAGYTLNDKNLWQFYWNLGEYVDDTGIIYLRAGYSNEHADILSDKGVGTDIIDYISYFESLEYEYAYL